MAVLIGGPALAALPSKPSYQQVLQALQRGANVHVLTKLQNCQTADTKQPGPPIEGGYTINSFIALPGKGIFFADAHQTINPAGQPDTEYVRYNLLSMRAGAFLKCMRRPNRRLRRKPGRR